MSNPLALILIIAAPVALVVLLMIWRRGRVISIDPWYGTTNLPAVSRASRIGGPHRRERRVRSRSVVKEAPAGELEVCKKVLFCWDYWSSGKSGLNLQDVFEARNLPAELRAFVNEANRYGETLASTIP